VSIWYNDNTSGAHIVQCRDAAAAIVRASVVRERRRRHVIYGGSRSNWLTTKEFNRIPCEFWRLARRRDTSLVGNSYAPFVNQQRSLLRVDGVFYFFFLTIFLILKRRARSAVTDGFFSDHFSSARSSLTHRRRNRDASARYDVGKYLEKKDALHSADLLQSRYNIVPLYIILLSTTVNGHKSPASARWLEIYNRDTHTHTHTQTVLGKEPIWVKGFHQDAEPIYTQTSANEIIQYKYCCIRNNRLRENLLERREKASVCGACEVIRMYIYTRRACVYRITGDVEGWR